MSKAKKKEDKEEPIPPKPEFRVTTVRIGRFKVVWRKSAAMTQVPSSKSGSQTTTLVFSCLYKTNKDEWDILPGGFFETLLTVSTPASELFKRSEYILKSLEKLCTLPPRVGQAATYQPLLSLVATCETFSEILINQQKLQSTSSFTNGN